MRCGRSSANGFWPGNLAAQSRAAEVGDRGRQLSGKTSRNPLLLPRRHPVHHCRSLLREATLKRSSGARRTSPMERDPPVGRPEAKTLDPEGASRVIRPMANRARPTAVAEVVVLMLQSLGSGKGTCNRPGTTSRTDTIQTLLDLHIIQVARGSHKRRAVAAILTWGGLRTLTHSRLECQGARPLAAV